MPYLWLSGVLFFGLHDEVFMAAVVTACFFVMAWASEELRRLQERVVAFDTIIIWADMLDCLYSSKLSGARQ